MNPIFLVKKIFNFFKYKAPDLFHRIIVIANYYEHDLASRTYDFRTNVKGYFRIIDNISDLESFKESFSLSQYIEYKERILKYRDKMFGFISGQKLLFWVWFTFKRDKYYEGGIGRDLIIPDDAVYSFDSNTLPDYCRRGLYAASFCEICPVLKKLNKKKMIFIIRTHDKAPMANAKKFNFKVKKKMIYINLGIFKFTFKI